MPMRTLGKKKTKMDAIMLATLLDRPPMLTDEEVAVAIAEEGWVLGIGHRELEFAGEGTPLWPAGHLPHKGESGLRPLPRLPLTFLAKKYRGLDPTLLRLLPRPPHGTPHSPPVWGRCRATTEGWYPR